MFVLLELLLIALLVWTTWRFWRARAAVLVAAGMARVVATIAATIVCLPVDFVTSMAVQNLILRLGISFAVGTLVYLAAAHFLLRSIRREESTIHKTIVQTDQLPRWADRTAVISFMGLLWGMTLLSLVAFAQLAAYSKYEPMLRSRTLVFSYFMPHTGEMTTANQLDQRSKLSERNGISAASASDLEERMRQQKLLFEKLRSGARHTGRRALELTGTDEFVDQLAALKRISTLPDEDRLWLVQHNQELADLLEHPSIVQIANNPRVLEMIDQLSAGELSMLYKLADDPDIQQLMDDETVRQAAAELDLPRMLSELDEHRANASSDVSADLSADSSDNMSAQDAR